MVKFAFNNTKVLGLSTVVPQKECCLLDDKTLYNGDTKRIKRIVNSSGFLKRRVNDPDVMTSDLCYQSACDLITKLDINKDEIDALLFLSYTPDYLMPATSYVLHKRLGLNQDCIVMDIPQACSGFVIGLYQSAMLINSGCKKVLLLVGDSFSKFSDMFNDNTAPVFGDAGSACLLAYDEKAEKMYFNIQSDGQGFDALMCVNGGFKNKPTPNDFAQDSSYKYESFMDGGRIFDFTINSIAPSIEELFKYSSVSKTSIDYFIFHQANKFILKNIINTLDVDIRKCPMETISKYGNQCGASIPCAISDSLQQEISNGKNKVLLSGFGVGLSWASAIISLEKIYCSKINEYKENKYE